MEEYAGAEVDDLHQAPGVGLHEYVLRLKVAMDNVKPMDVFHGSHYLMGDALHSPQVKVLGLLTFVVHAVSFEQVIAEQLCYDDEVLFVVEVVVEAENVLLVNLPVVVDVLEQLNLVDRLVDVVLVVIYYLHAVLLPILQV